MTHPSELLGNEYDGVPLVLTAGIQYTDPANPRFENSLLFTEIARDEGVPTIFVDSSPETWVADAHRQRGGLVLPAAIGGIATQRQQGVAFAVNHGAQKVVGTESEKVLVPLFADRISSALDEADIVVIGRTPSAENSLPPIQQRTERLAGWILQHTHSLPADSLAGPRGFTVAGAEVLADYPATEPGMNNWIYLYDTPIEARQRGLAIDGMRASFIYPGDIVAEETDNPLFDKKRLDQFTLQLGYLLPKISGAELSPQSRQVAELALDGVARIKQGDNIGEQLDVIAELESKLEDLGYQPPEKNLS